MPRDVRVGGLVIVALQQAIAEQLPTRAEFYDHWLSGASGRDGTHALAPMTAVFGFLRTEGAGYERVMSEAGRLAGAWTWEARTPLVRRWTCALPRWWRMRAMARQARRAIAGSCTTTQARVNASKGRVVLQVEGSVFCGGRDVPAVPLCLFYAAMTKRLFEAAGLGLLGTMDECRARRRPDAGPDHTGGGKEELCTGTFACVSAP